MPYGSGDVAEDYDNCIKRYRQVLTIISGGKDEDGHTHKEEMSKPEQAAAYAFWFLQDDGQSPMAYFVNPPIKRKDLE